MNGSPWRSGQRWASLFEHHEGATDRLSTRWKQPEWKADSPRILRDALGFGRDELVESGVTQLRHLRGPEVMHSLLLLRGPDFSSGLRAEDAGTDPGLLAE